MISKGIWLQSNKNYLQSYLALNMILNMMKTQAIRFVGLLKMIMKYAILIPILIMSVTGILHC